MKKRVLELISYGYIFGTQVDDVDVLSACVNTGDVSEEGYMKLIDKFCRFDASGPSLSVNTFVVSREWARLGAIHTVHALRQKGILKDVISIIGRAIFSQRGYYLWMGGNPNKK
jgi:hypothetical protein